MAEIATRPQLMIQQNIGYEVKPMELKKQRTVKQQIVPKEKKNEEKKPKLNSSVTSNQKNQTKLTQYNLNRYHYFSLTRGIVNDRINDWIKEIENENKVVPDFCYIPMTPMFTCKI